MKTKPFNLEEAKNGAKLVTRDGRSARIICYDRIREQGEIDIVALVKDNYGEEFVYSYNKQGCCNVNDNLDLFILDETEPQYMPYETTDELYEAIKQHGAFVKYKNTDQYNQIIGFYNDMGMYIELYSDINYIAGEFLAEYVWADDNTPCGKLKE